MFKRAIPKCTPDQQARQDRARELGCIACMKNVLQDFDCNQTRAWSEIHHLTRSGRQIGQDETICLCCWHHRGMLTNGLNTSENTEIFGPSLAKGSKPFHARYGDNATLLEYQNNLLKD